MTIPEWIKWISEAVVPILGLIGAALAFFFGFSRYKKEQIWKKKEFVANEMKEFWGDIMNRNALLMLDWDTREIELYPTHPDYEKRYAIIGRKELECALMPHEDMTRKFTKDETQIRDTIDHFLTNLTMFENFIKSGLIKYDDFHPYLRYWIKMISEGLPNEARNALHLYISHYQYREVQDLVKRFGKEILHVPRVKPLPNEESDK